MCVCVLYMQMRVCVRVCVFVFVCVRVRVYMFVHTPTIRAPCPIVRSTPQSDLVPNAQVMPSDTLTLVCFPPFRCDRREPVWI